MNLHNKTVLVTGGGTGIGFEIARLFSGKGNHVIITGRTESKLQQAAGQLTNVSYLIGDITRAEDIERLVQELQERSFSPDILINNAANASLYELTGADAFDKAAGEMLTNYLSVIRLTNRLLPLLRSRKEAAIVNVSSIVAFVPHSVLAGYGASKAALHSYTQSLRFLLGQSTSIQVFELMPPLVNTEFSREIGGSNGIPPREVAAQLWEGLSTDTYEIHVGRTADVYQAFLASPEEAFSLLNPV